MLKAIYFQSYFLSAIGNFYSYHPISIQDIPHLQKQENLIMICP